MRQDFNEHFVFDRPQRNEKSVLTLFTSPKAFAGHTSIIQHNALRNWKAIGAKIILCGNDTGVAEAAREYGAIHIADIAHTEFGTPLLSDMFAQAQAQADSPIVCYSNADIIFPPMLLAAAEKTYSECRGAFLMVGQRWDVDVQQSLDFSGAWEDVRVELQQGARLHPPCGIDYFCFSRGSIVVPSLAVGRPQWDNWMIWDAKRRGIPVVDATKTLNIFHQNHGYGHIPGRTGCDWKGSPEALYNADILKGISAGTQWGLVTVLSADRLLNTDFRIHRNITLRRCWGLLSLYGHAVWAIVWAHRALLKKFVGASFYSCAKQIWHRLRKALQ